ncbi:polysaccharide biosynthesis protein [Paenibacillus sp. PK3_47]|uniref:oligosaccharide flippase family protein n=1 Tax=Paenibacillus sp. PK3_47 TaxID=2072642 RepID=UPI00201DFD02|nr:oligosaccharide flippase family protein [Paenibacillus sp. PK3_47]UQZ34396.1 polysaccharide biosynthesis protein [Paenibacillus sp. PK3_47]
MKTNIRLAAIITYLSVFLGVIISLGSTPFIVSTLGKSEYGLFSLVNSIIAYIVLLDLGFGSAVVRFNSKYISENDTTGQRNINGMFLILFSGIGLISLLASLILVFNFESIFTSLNESELGILRTIFIIAAVNVAISFPMNIYSSIITAYERFVYLKIINLLRVVISPAMMVLVLIMGFRSVGMVSVALGLNIIIGLANYFVCRYKMKLVVKFSKFDSKLFKEVFSYSSYILLSSIAFQLYTNADPLIIGMFLGATPIAIYAISTQLNTYIMNFSNVLSSFYLPKLTKMIVKGANQATLMIELVRIGRIQALIVGYIVSGFVLFGQVFILIWLGEGYRYAYTIALIIIIPQITSIVQSLFATMLEAMNRHKVKALIYFSIAVLKIILTLIFIRVWGITGCAIATAAGMIVNVILNNIYYRYKLKFDIAYFWKEIIKVFIPVVLLSGVCGFLLTYVSISSYLQLGLYVILYSVLYAATMWTFSMNADEKLIVKGPMRKAVLRSQT